MFHRDLFRRWSYGRLLDETKRQTITAGEKPRDMFREKVRGRVVRERRAGEERVGVKKDQQEEPERERESSRNRDHNLRLAGTVGETPSDWPRGCPSNTSHLTSLLSSMPIRHPWGPMTIGERPSAVLQIPVKTFAYRAPEGTRGARQPSAHKNQRLPACCRVQGPGIRPFPQPVPSVTLQ